MANPHATPILALVGLNEPCFQAVLNNLKKETSSLVIILDSVEESTEIFLENRQRLVGIPVSLSAEGPGFTDLNEEVRGHIDRAVTSIREILEDHDYLSVLYRADDEGSPVSDKVVEEKVLDYVRRQIESLGMAIQIPKVEETSKMRQWFSMTGFASDPDGYFYLEEDNTPPMISRGKHQIILPEEDFVAEFPGMPNLVASWP